MKKVSQSDAGRNETDEKIDYIFSRPTDPDAKINFWHQHNPFPEIEGVRESMWSNLTVWELFFFFWFPMQNWDFRCREPLFVGSSATGGQWLQYLKARYPDNEVIQMTQKGTLDMDLLVRTVSRQRRLIAPAETDSCLYRNNATDYNATCNGSCRLFEGREGETLEAE